MLGSGDETNDETLRRVLGDARWGLKGRKEKKERERKRKTERKDNVWMRRQRDRPGNGKPIDPGEGVEGEKYFRGDLGFRHAAQIYDAGSGGRWITTD